MRSLWFNWHRLPCSFLFFLCKISLHESDKGWWTVSVCVKKCASMQQQFKCKVSQCFKCKFTGSDFAFDTQHGNMYIYIYIFTVIIAVCYVILYPMSFFPGYSLSGTRIEGTRLASLEAFNSDMGSKEVLKALKLERLNHFFNGKENRERNKEMMVSKMHDNLFFW